MKFIVLVALFAFVAVQVCQSTPVPDDDKTDKADKKDDPAAPAPVAADDTPAAAPVEKAEPATVDASAPAPKAEVPAEEKHAE